MWILKDNFLYDDAFPFFNLVTTRGLGDMKDEPNRKNVCSLKNIESASIVLAKQIHGKHAATVSAGDAGKVLDSTDALITGEKGLSLAVFTADCVPVFIGVKDKAVAVVHAGWRGLKAGIIPETIKLMSKKFGLEASQASASIGPHICKDCYTIGEEVKQAFGLAPTDTNFDLTRETVKQLKTAGVNNINDSGRCTMHEPDLFFSYRKDGTSSRIMSLVTF